MPKDFDRLMVRFRQFGGWRLVGQYARMGVLWTGVKDFVSCAVRGRSVKLAYTAITDRLEARLLEQGKDVLEDGLRRYGQSAEEGEKPKVVWTGWLQGEEQAPELVRMCWSSWRRHLPGYELRIVTMENFAQWTELPDWLVEKYRRGIIPPALFSDVMRLDLLVRHGGTWMDATVLCTGFPTERRQQQWAQIEASELCLFRYYRRGQKEPVDLSNWFISARPGHAVLAIVRDMLMDYWSRYDCTVDYYICHLFLGAVLQRFPLIAATMPRCNSTYSILLGDALASDYDEAAWRELTDHVSLHKLNFRKADAAARNPRSYYCKIFKEGVSRS